MDFSGGGLGIPKKNKETLEPPPYLFNLVLAKKTRFYPCGLPPHLALKLHVFFDKFSLNISATTGPILTIYGLFYFSYFCVLGKDIRTQF